MPRDKKNAGLSRKRNIGPLRITKIRADGKSRAILAVSRAVSTKNRFGGACARRPAASGTRRRPPPCYRLAAAWPIHRASRVAAARLELRAAASRRIG